MKHTTKYLAVSMLFAVSACGSSLRPDMDNLPTIPSEALVSPIPSPSPIASSNLTSGLAGVTTPTPSSTPDPNETSGTPTPTPTPSVGAGEGNAIKPTDAQEAIIRQYMKTVLDTPHAYAGGASRGGPGVYEAMSEATIEEFVASIADNANRYLPSSLSFNEKVALLIADINAESSFNAQISVGRGEAGSLGVQQVTGTIWVPEFQNKASGTDLYFYDGTLWVPSTTTINQMATSIWDNTHVANWAISTQAINGGRDANAGPGGPMARTWWTGLYCWVSGYPAAQAGGDVAQSSKYRLEQQSDLTLLGLNPNLIDTAY